jgi:glycosyltransferase involved in cell wall biosynthesis
MMGSRVRVTQAAPLPPSIGAEFGRRQECAYTPYRDASFAMRDMPPFAPSILVAIPLFEGWEHVEETLRSVKDQTYAHFRVLISVDGGDRRSYDACAAFLSDPRFEIVLHEERLGWAGNVNWLATQLREDYFCYWQHDDYCDRDYIRILAEHAVHHPEAASIYCDMQLFGTANKIVRHKSVTGFALERVLAQARRASPAVIRCLVRSDALRASLPISLASVWTLALARAGELHRVPQVLYFRRMREDSVGARMLSRSDEEMLAATLEFSLGFMKYAHSLVQPAEHGHLLAFIVEEVVTLQTRGRYQFDFSSAPPEIRAAFIAQFLDAAVEQFALDPAAKPSAQDWLGRATFTDADRKPRKKVRKSR